MLNKNRNAQCKVQMLAYEVNIMRSLNQTFDLLSHKADLGRQNLDLTSHFDFTHVFELVNQNYCLVISAA